MPRTIVYLLLLCFAHVSCSDETLNKTLEPAKHTIELVALGFADNPTEENKSFGAAYYFYLDLDRDSVFIQYKTDTGAAFITIAKAGTIKGLSKAPRILAFIQAANQYENGKTISPPIEEGVLYCGYSYYARYVYNDRERFHYYTTHELDERLEQATRYMLSLQSDNNLKAVNKFVYQDSVIVPIVNHASFEFVPPPPPDLPPPPPVRPKVR